mmetsp:Transcript_702/g.1052  ORF Transcript_702/g.1052 Transcript_702/m.1052 type:complete len:284 (-) Transcript_702:156-1007(-)
MDQGGYVPPNPSNPFADPAVSLVSAAPPSQSAPVVEYPPPPASQPPPSSSVSGTQPPWLAQSAQQEPPPSAYAQPQEAHSQPPQSAPFFSQPTNTNQPPAAPPAAPGEPLPLKENLPKLVTYMRLANVVIAILMVTSAILNSLGNADLSTLVLGCYVSCFGCLLCCFETHLKQVSIMIADNCGFLYSAKGRCVFLILIATLCFSLNVIGKITGGLTVAVACLNLYVICKFPQYETETRQADMNGAGPDARALAGRMAVDYAKNNPDQVRQVAAAGASQAYANV